MKKEKRLFAFILAAAMVFSACDDKGASSTPESVSTTTISETASTKEKSKPNSMTKVKTTPPEIDVPDETSSQTAEETDSSSTTIPDYNKGDFADDLFIGDSISTGLSLYGLLDSDNVFAKQGLNPDTIHDTTVETALGELTAAQYAKERQPKRIFIMLGSNGIAFMSDSGMLDGIDTLVKDFQRDTTAKIFLISITPVGKDAAVIEDGLTNDRVNAYNKELKAYAEENGLTYVDLNSRLLDSDGNFNAELAENDGLHFKLDSYKIMLGLLEEVG